MGPLPGWGLSCLGEASREAGSKNAPVPRPALGFAKGSAGLGADRVTVTSLLITISLQNTVVFKNGKQWFLDLFLAKT